MSYKNPFREQLKEDRARDHWESHVLLLDPDSIRCREEAAAKRGITRRELEEERFQKWYQEKKDNGFANFSDGAAYEPGW